MAGFWYLASPYSAHPDGFQTAYREACEQAAIITKAGVNAMSPIAHSQPIAVWGNIDKFDHDTWLRLDAALIDAAHGMIWLELPGSENSRGMQWELDRFLAQGKFRVRMKPGHIPSVVQNTEWGEG